MGATLGKSGGHFLDALPTQSTVHVVMLGLDSAGKTTALYRLKFDQYLNTVPTIGFNCEKVQGTLGKAKGVQFLVWDVGGQEKLRPLWRSYTRCTDGILFVIDSVDIERMEEAKMELMRTAKCPDNQGVPVLILANKQDLPGAQDAGELEKLLGLHELLYYANIMVTTTTTTTTPSSSATTSSTSAYNMNAISSLTTATTPTTTATTTKAANKNENDIRNNDKIYIPISLSYTTSPTTKTLDYDDDNTTTTTTATATTNNNNNHNNNTSTFRQQQQPLFNKSYSQEFKANTPTTTTTSTTLKSQQQNKCWFIQPACAITGEGLQEGLEALYEMILRRRKLNKVQKRRR